MSAPEPGRAAAPEVPVHLVQLWLCDLCLNGAGGECHSPGCSLWINRAPDLSLRNSPFVKVIDNPAGDQRAAAPTPGQAAYEHRTAAQKRRFPARLFIAWDRLSPAERADEEAAAAAAIATMPDFTEHPSCDAHRWYAVVKHCGSFAYGFAATSDGLRVWDDASEFEYAKARDFE